MKVRGRSLAGNGKVLLSVWELAVQKLINKTKDNNMNESKIENGQPTLQQHNVSSSGFVSGCCEGEKCSVCGKPATNKLEETIFHDDPYPMRHPLTAYVCKEHFRMIVGSLG